MTHGAGMNPEVGRIAEVLATEVHIDPCYTASDLAELLYAVGLRATGLDVERLARARLWLIDQIGTDLSRELVQGDPFEPYDRAYVAKVVTRVLDAARDRVNLAAGQETPK